MGVLVLDFITLLANQMPANLAIKTGGFTEATPIIDLCQGYLSVLNSVL